MYLRELQKVVSEERAKREKAESSVEATRAELASLSEACVQSKKEAAEASAKLVEIQERVKDNKESSGATTVKLKNR